MTGSLLTILLAVPATLAALIAGLGAFFAWMMIAPPRLPLWRRPTDVGMRYEDVAFPAEDGVTLSGWFIPRRHDDGTSAPAVVLVHGWPWNRLGTAGRDLMSRLVRAPAVDLLRPARALHQVGYHVLAFDLRNHGASGRSRPVTFGRDEAKDLLGALAYLRRRADVDPRRIGALGYSMGANAVLFAAARSHDLKAAVAVQPLSPAVFAPRFARTLLGPLARPVRALAQFLYQRAGGVPLEALDPLEVVPQIERTPLLFLQGEGDPWGNPENVHALCERTAGPKTLRLVPGRGRYEGYLYLGEHPDELLRFFSTHL